MKTYKEWQQKLKNEEKAGQKTPKKPSDQKQKQNSKTEPKSKSKPKQSAQPQTQQPTKNIELEAIEKPSWRKGGSVKQLDQKAKSRNTLLSVVNWLIWGALSIAVIIVGYYLWDSYIAEKILPTSNNGRTLTVDTEKKDGDSESDSDDDAEDASQFVDKEITYYLVEIGVAGTREIKTGEIKTDCGDILIPVKEVVTFTKASIKEDGLVGDIALIKGSLEQLFTYEKGLTEKGEGLVNEVPTDTLEIEKVLQIGENYEVYLKGTVTAIGECAAERMKAQLQKTAEFNISEGEITFKINDSSSEYDNIGTISSGVELEQVE